MLYIDNDCIITLAELNLAELLCEAMSEDHCEYNVFRLRSCAAFVSDQLVEPERSRAIAFLAKTGPVSSHLHGTEYQELSKIENVDLEAELYACCSNDHGATVASGDIKCIRAIAQSASVPTLKKLDGRVRCTEQCLLAIIDHVGFLEVSRRWAGSSIDHNFFTPLLTLDEGGTRATIAGRLDGFSPPMKRLLSIP